MDASELIIGYIKQLSHDIANHDIDNSYLFHHKREAIDELTQDLIKQHGYKDEQAVQDKITELFEKERSRHDALKFDFEKRQARILKQEQIKETPKNHIRIRKKKRRGLGM